MEILMIAVLIGLVPAMIASKKGKSFGLWWFFGAMLFIIALPAALLATDETKRPCPFCSASIPKQAALCMFCTKPVAGWGR